MKSSDHLFSDIDQKLYPLSDSRIVRMQTSIETRHFRAEISAGRSIRNKETVRIVRVQSPSLPAGIDY